MAGSSIATPAAAPWVTDFLNAAYYARAEDERRVEDLRLAHGILTTYWRTRRGRLGLRHVLPFHRGFGRHRLSKRGRLDHGTMLEGAQALLGDWFAEAWSDDRRRAYGMAFEAVAERAAYRPEVRMRRAALKAMTPPTHAPEDQHWATYDPVRLPDPDAAIEFLTDPSRWPDMGSANGRFTPLRGGGLPGQTFEIEVVAEGVPRSPVFTRGYVTATTVETGAPGLQSAVADLGARYEAGAPDGRPLMSGRGEPVALIVLTTHDGHFLGRALSQLLIWSDPGGTWIRDVGAWDPMPVHIAAAYKAAGEQAQHQFWGPEPVQRSMLAQLALVA